MTAACACGHAWAAHNDRGCFAQSPHGSGCCTCGVPAPCRNCATTNEAAETTKADRRRIWEQLKLAQARVAQLEEQVRFIGGTPTPLPKLCGKCGFAWSAHGHNPGGAIGCPDRRAP